MATGRVGASDLAVTTNTSVYTCPSNTFSVVTVSICNRNSTSATVRLALAAAGAPTTAEYLEYDVQLVGNGTLERTGLVMAAGQIIVAYSNVTGVNVVVYGIETSTA